MIGNAYSVAPIAAILSPLFLGIVADRFFASQKVMAGLHFVGGLLLLAAPSIAEGPGKDNAWLFIGLLLAHMLCYMPTLGLTNTIAFNAMNNPEKQFPIVRVWGTIGWIVAGVAVGFLTRQMITAQGSYKDLETARNASPFFFYIAGASGVILGLFSLALPNTPPPMRGKPVDLGSIIGIESIRLLKDRSFFIFALCSMLVCIPLAAYYSFGGTYAGAAGVENVPFKMTFGQMSEIFFMLVMPLFFARLGVKWMLAVGMFAWVVRYALFSLAWSPAGGQVGLILGGILLHGICYDFFFVTGQIYTERAAPKEIRAQAQGFLVLLTQGVGMLIGNQVFGRLFDHYTTKATGTDWKTVWMIPSAFALGILILFVLTFSGKSASEQSAKPSH
jgi:nucleoside transporter